MEKPAGIGVRHFLAAAGLAALAGCAGAVGGTSPAPVQSAAAGSGPSACALPIAEFEAIVDADYQTGNVNPSVYRRIVAELQPVKASCASGQTAAANARLATVKSRHGYR